MVTITLTENEAAVLRLVIDSYLSDLRMEISDTDSYDFREILKARKDVLAHVLNQLPPPAGPSNQAERAETEA